MYEEEDQTIQVAFHQTGIARFTQSEVNGRNVATIIATNGYSGKAIMSVYEEMGSNTDWESFKVVFTSLSCSSLSVHENQHDPTDQRYVSIRAKDRYGAISEMRIYGTDLDALANAIDAERMSRVMPIGGEGV